MLPPPLRVYGMFSHPFHSFHSGIRLVVRGEQKKKKKSEYYNDGYDTDPSTNVYTERTLGHTMGIKPVDYYYYRFPRVEGPECWARAASFIGGDSHINAVCIYIYTRFIRIVYGETDGGDKKKILKNAAFTRRFPLRIMRRTITGPGMSIYDSFTLAPVRPCDPICITHDGPRLTSTRKCMLYVREQYNRIISTLLSLRLVVSPSIAL